MIKRTTILVEEKLWKKFRIKALEENKTATELLEELIKKKLSIE